MTRPQDIIVQDRMRLYGESLKLCFEVSSDLVVAAIVENIDQLLDRVAASQPFAVIMEGDAAHWDAVAAIRHLRQTYPTLRILATARSGDNTFLGDEVVVVDRTAPGSTFVAAIEDPALVRHHEHGAGTTSYGLERITRREIQVLALMGKGSTTEQIADRLGISAKTVESRRQSLFTKLGVQNQSHAVSVALKAGLLGGSVNVP